MSPSPLPSSHRALKLTSLLLILGVTLGSAGIWLERRAHLQVLSLARSGHLDDLVKSRERHKEYEATWGKISPQRFVAQKTQIRTQTQRLFKARLEDFTRRLEDHAELPPQAWLERPEQRALLKDLTSLSEGVSLSGSPKDHSLLASQAQTTQRLIAWLTRWSTSLREAEADREGRSVAERSLTLSLDEPHVVIQRSQRDKHQGALHDGSLSRALMRYHFAWCRRWSKLVIQQREGALGSALWTQPTSIQTAEALKSGLKTQTHDLYTLIKLKRLIEVRSPELAGLTSLSLRRAIEARWRLIWSAHRQVINRDQFLEKLSALSLFFKIFKEAVTLTSPGEAMLSSEATLQQSSRVSLPQETLTQWRADFEKLDIFKLAQLIETSQDPTSLNQLYASSQSDVSRSLDPSAPTLTQVNALISSLWFESLLTSTQRRSLITSLMSFKVREQVKGLFSQSRLTKAEAEHLKAQLSSFSAVSASARELSREINQLLKPQWRSFSGEVTCIAEHFSIGQWHDAMFDKLIPYLALKSDTDQANLSERVGRMKWGVTSQQTLLVQVWDDDRVGADDLISQASLPTPIQLIIGDTLESNGCKWRVKLEVSARFEGWLREGKLPLESSR